MSTKKFTKKQFEEIFFRLMQLTGLKFEYQVGEMFGITSTNLSQRKNRGSVPVDKIAIECSKQGWDLNWVLTGEGEMIQRPAAEAKEQINETHAHYRPDMTPTDKVLLNSVTDKIFDRYFRQESAEKKHNFIDRLLKELEGKE